MNQPIIFEAMDGGHSEPIDIEQVFTVIIEGGVIIAVYNNGASDRFPATQANIDLAYQIIRALKNRPRPY